MDYAQLRLGYAGWRAGRLEWIKAGRTPTITPAPCVSLGPFPNRRASPKLTHGALEITHGCYTARVLLKEHRIWGTDPEDFMRHAIDLAVENVRTGTGGPFGAVVVKAGNVVATGVNLVTSTNDPTSHAEVVAIRAACRTLSSFQLRDCEIYTNCEPCPMCLGAIYWARLARFTTRVRGKTRPPLTTISSSTTSCRALARNAVSRGCVF